MADAKIPVQTSVASGVQISEEALEAIKVEVKHIAQGSGQKIPKLHIFVKGEFQETPVSVPEDVKEEVVFHVKESSQSSGVSILKPSPNKAADEIIHERPKRNRKPTRKLAESDFILLDHDIKKEEPQKTSLLTETELLSPESTEQPQSQELEAESNAAAEKISRKSKRTRQPEPDSKQSNICDKCGKHCRSHQGFLKHREVCQRSECLCVECGKVFKKPYLLKRHQNRKHNPDWVSPDRDRIVKRQPTVCAECGKLLNSKSSMIIHMKIHQQKREFNCPHCPLTFIQKGNMMKHIESIHKLLKPYLCTTCGSSFTQQAGLDYHMRQHLYRSRMEKIAELTDTEQSSVPDNSSNPGITVKCLFCEENDTNLLRYLHHLKDHLNDDSQEWDESSQTLAEQLIDMNKDILTKAKVYKCQHCNKVFDRIASLNDHLPKHRDNVEVSFSCGECNVLFGSRTSLKLHKRTAHRDLFHLECQHCGKIFKRTGQLQRHITAYHTTGLKTGKRVAPKRSFQCETCSKSFPAAYNLKVHMRTHAKEKPFACIACGQTFADPSNLIAHGRRHHSDMPKELFTSRKKMQRKVMRELAQTSLEEQLSASEHPQQQQQQMETINKELCAILEIQNDNII